MDEKGAGWGPGAGGRWFVEPRFRGARCPVVLGGRLGGRLGARRVGLDDLSSTAFGSPRFPVVLGPGGVRHNSRKPAACTQTDDGPFSTWPCVLRLHHKSPTRRAPSLGGFLKNDASPSASACLQPLPIEGGRFFFPFPTNFRNGWCRVDRAANGIGGLSRNQPIHLIPHHT